MISDEVMPQIALAVKRLTGLHVEPEKYYLFEHRFPEVMREFGIASFADLLLQLSLGTNVNLINRIIEKITTHETKFFRDESIFAAFSEQIIPEWKERAMPQELQTPFPPLRIWSAACATGQEAYSIAMMLAEYHPQLVRTAKILATDISTESVHRASSGYYSDFEISRGVPEKLLEKYFTRRPDGFQVNKTTLPPIEFRSLNLVQDTFPDSFDIIFCRNVAYYFSQHTRAGLFERIRRAAAKNGILILGSAESLNGILSNYVLREFGLARYYEINTENVTIFPRLR